MENTYIFAIIFFGVYALICHECGKVARRKGLKYSDAFLVALFGSPVVGFLYIIANQLPAIQGEEKEPSMNI